MSKVEIPTTLVAQQQFVPLARNGDFSTLLPDEASEISLRVRNRAGAIVSETLIDAKSAGEPINIMVKPPQSITYSVSSDDKLRLYGRAFDMQGKVRMSNEQVLVWATSLLDRPIALAKTDSEGNFIVELPKMAATEVVQIALLAYPNTATTVDVSKLAARELVFLPINTEKEEEKHSAARNIDDNNYDTAFSEQNDCGCNHSIGNLQTKPQIFTSMEAWVAAADAAQPLGTGVCDTMYMPNQALEEFTMFSIMRTSHMVTRQYELNPLTNKFEIVAVGPEWTNDADAKDYSSPVAWDRERDEVPKIYMASYFGHGRILVYKQTYSHAGHSLGDLLYTLALAPGQKEQIVKREWSRSESASRSESLDATDSLAANMTTNRDISEVVSGSVRETINADSSVHSDANTGGASLGVDLTPILGFPLGVGGGYQGSQTTANSTSHQDSIRTTAMNTMQRLQQNTNQSANSVRSQRSTVIQTVTQTENLNIKTSVVANHNHCHAINILYHEVLAHYVVETRLADVQECLFIPLQIQPFDYRTVSRYRDILERFCRLPKGHPVRQGFAAIDRIQSGVSFMGAKNDTMLKVAGELSFTFALQRPADKPNPTANATPTMLYDDTKWAEYLPYMTGIDTVDLATKWNNSTDRRQYFDTKVAPIIMQNFVSKLQIGINKISSEADELTILPNVRLKMVQPYIRGNSITVKIVQTGSLVNIGLNMAVLPDHLVIKVTETVSLPSNLVSIQLNSAFVTYDTVHYKDNTIISSSDTNQLIADHSKDGLLNDDATYKAGVTAGLDNVQRDPFTHHIPLDKSFFEVSGGSGSRFSTPDEINLAPGTGTWGGWGGDPAVIVKPNQVNQELGRKLVQHLNQYIEYYHRMIWMNMDPDRRWLMLDGIAFKEITNNGVTTTYTVASFVENRVVGVVGNCIVMPVARGVILDNYTLAAPAKNLFDVFKDTTPPTQTRITLPTSGVFAETLMSRCGICEKIDDSVAQDWTKFTSDEPTAIATVGTESNAQPRPDLTAGEFNSPIINIQNTPNLPDPQGMSAMGHILSSAGLFNDMTGLAGNQNLAASTLEQTVKAYGINADMAKAITAKAQQEYYANNGNKIMDSINKSGLSDDKKKELKEKALQQMIGGDNGTNTPSTEQQNTTNNNDFVHQNNRNVPVTEATHHYADGSKTEMKFDTTRSTPPTPPKKWIKSGAGDHVIENPLYAEEREQYEQDLEDWERVNGASQKDTVMDTAVFQLSNLIIDPKNYISDINNLALANLINATLRLSTVNQNLNQLNIAPNNISNAGIKATLLAEKQELDARIKQLNDYWTEINLLNLARGFSIKIDDTYVPVNGVDAYIELDSNANPKQVIVQVDGTRTRNKLLALLAHELKHVYQFYEGKLCLKKSTIDANGNIRNGRSGPLYDIQDEVESYSRQMAFDKTNVLPNTNGTFASINSAAIRALGGDYAHLSEIQLGINSSLGDIKNAYTYPLHNSFNDIQQIPNDPLVLPMLYTQSARFSNYYHYDKMSDTLLNPPIH
jgi:hypothetical protein